MSSKYGNLLTEYRGFTFSSRAEQRRYAELELLRRAGEITGLTVHPRYELQPAFKRDGKRERAIVYEADFQYHDKDGRLIVEDVKAHGKATVTRAFSIKRKMFLYKYPQIEFRIVES